MLYVYIYIYIYIYIYTYISLSLSLSLYIYIYIYIHTYIHIHIYIYIYIGSSKSPWPRAGSAAVGGPVGQTSATDKLIHVLGHHFVPFIFMIALVFCVLVLVSLFFRVFCLLCLDSFRKSRERPTSLFICSGSSSTHQVSASSTQLGWPTERPRHPAGAREARRSAAAAIVGR